MERASVPSRAVPEGAPGEDLGVAGIELVGVAKRYPGADEPAVLPTDVRIAAGEFFSLLGPSGCGKSTTLRMIAGFEAPTSGRILLHGEDVTAAPPNRRDVNLVFQSYALFPHLDVAGNVGFGLRRKKVPKPEIARRVQEALALVSLEGYGARRPSELSGGQQQRVAVARALVNRPRALLLDEPLGALDLKLRQSMQTELKRIQREVGITFVYVTHDQSEALTMSDRIAVMNGGRIEQIASPKDVYEQPATRFVAGFIGVSNLLGGRIEAVDGDLLRLASHADDRLLVPALPGLRAGDEATFTIRPEKIALVDDADPGACRLRATVVDVAYQGVSTSYGLRTRTGEAIVAFEPNAGGAILPAGRELWLTWRPEHGAVIPESVHDAAPDARSAR